MYPCSYKPLYSWVCYVHYNYGLSIENAIILLTYSKLSYRNQSDLKRTLYSHLNITGLYPPVFLNQKALEWNNKVIHCCLFVLHRVSNNINNTEVENTQYCTKEVMLRLKIKIMISDDCLDINWSRIDTFPLNLNL